MKALGWAVGTLALAGLAAPAEAIDWRDIFGRGDRYYGRDPGRIAYHEGYRDGINKGERDGRKGERYSLRRHRDYRNADDGYRRQFGPKYAYQRVYRQGFEAGYRRAYASYGYGRYGYGRYGYGRDRYGRGRDQGRYGDRGRYDDDDYDRGRRY